MMKVLFHFILSSLNKVQQFPVQFQDQVSAPFAFLLLLREKFEDLGTFWQTDREDKILPDGNFNLENFLCIEFY